MALFECRLAIIKFYHFTQCVKNINSMLQTVEQGNSKSQFQLVANHDSTKTKFHLT